MVVATHELMGSPTIALIATKGRGGLVAEDACLNPLANLLHASDQEASCQKSRAKKKFYVKTSCLRCVIVDGNLLVELLYA